jgi:hypothetical protein
MKDKNQESLPPNPLLNHSGTLKGYFMAKMRRMYRRDKFELLKPLVKAITSKWFIRRRFIDFKSYKTLYPNKVDILAEENISLKFSSIKFYGEGHDDSIHEIKNHYSYSVKLNDVMIIGCSDLILLDDKYALYDLRYLDADGAIDYTDYAIKFLKDDECVIEANWAHSTIDEAILLSSNYSINYYHFLLEIVAKFEKLSKLGIDKSIPIIIDRPCLEILQYVELLSYFNSDNRQIIPVEKEVIYKVSSLYHISCPNIIPPNFNDITQIKAKHNLYDVASLLFVRNKLLESSTTKEYSKRIFISRKNASGRRVYNEEEVYNLLKKHNFSIFYPEEHSLLEQVAIFQNAEFIVGATGAAFTNLLFCSDTCKVICLTNFKINISIFSTIARVLNTDLVYIFDKKLILTKDSDLHSNFNIDTKQLNEALEDIMKLK